MQLVRRTRRNELRALYRAHARAMSALWRTAGGLRADHSYATTRAGLCNDKREYDTNGHTPRNGIPLVSNDTAPKVKVTPCFWWDCPACSSRSIAYLQFLKDDDLNAEAREEFGEGELVACPEKVVCNKCLKEFDVDFSDQITPG